MSLSICAMPVKAFCPALFQKRREKRELFVQGEASGQAGNAGSDVVFLAFKVKDAVCDAVGNLFHLGGAHAAGGHSRGAKADTAGHKRAALFTGNSVLVGSNVYFVQVVLQLLDRKSVV